MDIRPTTPEDRAVIHAIHASAFGQAEEAELTLALLDDATARPVTSLLALAEDGTPVGHVLFSAARLKGAHAAILAPLAVRPEAQGKGVGAALVRAGLQALHAQGVALVFVYGDPAYYAPFGFAPARPHGLEPPHPIPDQYTDAWMVEDLNPGVLGHVTGVVHCAKALDRPELWWV